MRYHPLVDSLAKPKVRLRRSGCLVLKSALEQGKLNEYSYGWDPDLRQASLHRIAFYRAHGWVPKGYHNVVRHLCNRKACFEVTHLAAGTQQTNTVSDSKISIVSVNARKTHCVNGHEFTPENTYHYRDKKGRRRICRACVRERSFRKYHAHGMSSPWLR
jgi:HNH endonuclease